MEEKKTADFLSSPNKDLFVLQAITSIAMYDNSMENDIDIVNQIGFSNPPTKKKKKFSPCLNIFSS